MRRSWAILIPILFFTCEANAQKPKSDREDDGLKGPVQKVVSENAKLSNVDGKLVEGGRELSKVITYDLTGDILKIERYDKEGLLETETYGYLEGDRMEKLVTALGRVRPGGYGPRRTLPQDPRYTIKFKYKYDSQGNRIEVISFRNDGVLASRSVRVYDGKGNRIEESFYDSNGSRYTKVTNSYDYRGNITESSDELNVHRFDKRYSYEYEFDARGNWTKRTISQWVTKGGKSLFEPYLINYRTITYF